MIVRVSRRFRGPIIAGAVALAVVGASQLSGTAGTLVGNPCPSSWFPLPAQPYATQVACGQLRQQADLNDLATAQARPYATSVPPTPNPALAGPPVLSGYIPDSVKTIQPISSIRLAGAHVPVPVTSVWRAGYLASANHRGYAEIIVYAVGTSAHAAKPFVIREFWPTGDMADPGFDYGASWIAPRDIGDIAITAITGPTGVVSFTTKAGVTGTLDMATGTWTLSP